MVRTQKLRKPLGCNARRSAAWGKRLGLVLVLASSMAFGQVWRNPSETGRFSRMSPELSGMLAQAKRGEAHGQTVKVIVQYKQVPTASHYATMQSRGGRLHAKLHMIKGASFTIRRHTSAAAKYRAARASAPVCVPIVRDWLNSTTT